MRENFKMNINSSLFGLPREVKRCNKCTFTNQKPNSTIEFRSALGDTKTGLQFKGDTCVACEYSESKDEFIDWDMRRKALSEVCDKFRSKNESFDCIVPGSGGKDSFFAALVLKEEFGMNPLTVTWAPHIYTDWGWKNFKKWIDSGLPNYLYHPNGMVHRFLSRLALENLFHPFQPFIIGQYGFPIKCCKIFNVKLVFYGENSAEYGNNLDDHKDPYRAYEDIALFEGEESYVAGEKLSDISRNYNIKQADLKDYAPPKIDELVEMNLEWHYLGYYLKWHPQSNYYFSTKYGFEPAPERNAGSYSRYTSLDDKLDDFNFYCFYIKYGLGRATFDTAQEVKRGDINIEEARALVKRFDGEFPDRFAEDLFNYWSINQISNANSAMLNAFESPEVNLRYFNKLSDKFRSPHLWKFDLSNNNWILNKNE